MRRILTGLLLSALAASPALADDDYSATLHDDEQAGISVDEDNDAIVDEEAGISGDEAGISETTTADVQGGYLKNEGFSLKPHAGVVVFSDPIEDDTTRGVVGLQLAWNLARAFEYSTPLYFGVETGGFFSHLGSPGSNFFGSDDNGLGGGGANMVLIPANLKVGIAPVDSVRLSAHGGGNVLYRSVATAINAGTDLGAGEDIWRIYPNVGGEIEFSLGRNAALSLRPDWTITPGDDFFVGTLGLGLAIG
jgi:hypothetical protein